MESAFDRTRASGWVLVAVVAMLSAGAFAILGESYLLFHTLIELMAAVVALGVFSIAWHTRRISESDYITFIGLAVLPVGVITILHALAYNGMPVFPGYGTNLPTQLWVIARALQASAFLVAPVFLVRRLRRPGVVLGLYVAVGAAAVAAAFAGLFPTAFVEGQGLTPFKVGMEYAVIAATLLGALGLFANRAKVLGGVRTLLYASMATTVVAEFLFTLYSDPFGLSNRLGHAAHLAAFLLIYGALVQTSLERPIDTLFRQLKQRETDLAETYEAEHDIAETLQDAMALQTEHVPGLQLSHRYIPAPGRGRIGGDFYDLLRVGDHLVAFSIGDVCGKGIKAAMNTVKARSALRAMALTDPDPIGVLEGVNSYLRRELAADSFVTAVYGTIDTLTGRVRLAVAGHPGPVVCGRPDAELPDELRAPPLGVLDRLDVRGWEIVLEPGDSLVLVTDGVLEAGGPDGVGGRFGSKRLLGLLHSIPRGETAEAVVEEVVRTLNEHTGRHLDDDVAIMAIRLGE